MRWSFRNKNKQEAETPEERARWQRKTALEYIVSLKAADKRRFYEAADKIWEGYSTLDNVLTENERIVIAEAKRLEAEDTKVDGDTMGFLMEEELKKEPSVPVKEKK